MLSFGDAFVQFGDFFFGFGLFLLDRRDFRFGEATGGKFFLLFRDEFFLFFDFALDFFYFFLFGFAQPSGEAFPSVFGFKVFFDRRVQLDRADADRFAVVGADLELDFFRGVEQVLAVEAGRFADALDLVGQLRDLGDDRFLVFFRGRAVRVLNAQLANALSIC